MSRFKRLLVPTDFSPTAGIALQYAVRDNSRAADAIADEIVAVRQAAHH